MKQLKLVFQIRCVVRSAISILRDVCVQDEQVVIFFLYVLPVKLYLSRLLTLLGGNYNINIPDCSLLYRGAHHAPKSIHSTLHWTLNLFVL